MLTKLCSLKNTSPELVALRKTFELHKKGLHEIASATKNNIEGIFSKYLNTPLLPFSINIKNSSLTINELQNVIFYYLYLSLQNLLKCSDVVIYKVEIDQIHGKTQNDYLWVKTLFADPNHFSRFIIEEVHTPTNGTSENSLIQPALSLFEEENSSTTKKNNLIKLLNIFNIVNQKNETKEVMFENIIVPIEIDDNGILFVKIPETKDENNNVITTKNIEVSGATDTSIRLPLSSRLSKKLLVINPFPQQNSSNEEDKSISFLAKDKNQKPIAIFYQEALSDIGSSKRILHTASTKAILSLIAEEKRDHLINDLLKAILKEGIMIEIHREQEFQGTAGLSIVALAHNMNRYVELIMHTLKKGGSVEIKEEKVYLNGEALELLDHDKNVFKERVNATLEIIQVAQEIIKEKEKKQIESSARYFTNQRNTVIENEKDILETTYLSNLQVCYFKPINLKKILPLLNNKNKEKSFKNFLETNKTLLRHNNEEFLNIMTLGRRSQLLNGFFEGKAPIEIEKMLQPKLKGRIICKPKLDVKNKRIQTEVILLFNKSITKNPEELIKAFLLQDELTSQIILYSETIKSMSSKARPFIKKSDDGKMIELIIDYDIWTYPERKIFFRFSEGADNILQYNESGSEKTATGIPNILLSKDRVNIVRTPEWGVSQFFEKIFKERKVNFEDDILKKCSKNEDFKKMTLSYFIRNLINDPIAFKIDTLLLKLLFKHLLKTKEDAHYSILQIKAYQKEEDLQNNPFYTNIKKLSERKTTLLNNF